MWNKIKMRTNNDEHSICKVCGESRDRSLDMFDIAFDKKHIITICDKCTDDLFNLSLKAVCKVNAKLKSQRDIKIIQMRNRRKEINGNRV